MPHKMSNLHHLALFLALVSACFCNTTITAMDSTNKKAQATIRLYIALPKEAQPVNMTCSSASFVVPAEKEHDWSVPVDKVESCHAIWGHFSASFNAFEPNVDSGYNVILLMAKLDGFFHSWGKITWDKKAGWIGVTEH